MFDRNDFREIQLKGNTLGIERGSYPKDDANEAFKKIQEFCNSHQVKIEGSFGFNDLYIDDKRYPLGRFDLDINTMFNIMKEHNKPTENKSVSPASKTL